MHKAFLPAKLSLPAAFALLATACGGGGGSGGGVVLGSGPTYIKASDSADFSERFGGTFQTLVGAGGDDTLALSDDGTTLAIGMPGRESGSGHGGVYVLTKSAGNWSYQAILSPTSDSDNGDQFGSSVALSANGNTLAIGAPDEDGGNAGPGASRNDNAPNAGATYVFTRSGGSWTEQEYIKASNPDSGDQFGFGVALSDDGNTLAVGATGEEGSGSGVGPIPNNNGSGNEGAVYVFTRSGSIWTEEEYIKSTSVETNDYFGFAVALAADGDTLAVGAEQDGNTVPANKGAVHVYTRSGAVWSFQEELKPVSLAANDRLGTSVALSDDGDTLAAGANRADSFAGAVYVFARDGIGNWSEQDRLTASNGEGAGNGDRFGSSVSLTDDGDSLVSGAPLEDSAATGLNGNTGNSGSANFESGAAYLFTRSGGNWGEQTYIKATNTDGGDRFGESVALSGDGSVLAVGAGGEDGGDEGVNADDSDNSSMHNAGAVYVY